MRILIIGGSNFSYAAVKQLEGKYLVQSRSGDIYERLNFIHAGCRLSFAKHERSERLELVKRFYDATSTFKPLPTPIMSGIRTPTRQFSSCVLIECDDSLNSINATASSIVKYVSQCAGIGINAGRIRALGSHIRNGEAFPQVVFHFINTFKQRLKALKVVSVVVRLPYFILCGI